MDHKHTILDKVKLKQITDASHTATVVMIALGFRERSHAETSLFSVKRQLASMGETINDRDYMDFWRGLESCGAGTFIVGRKGNQTRFEWNYPLIDVAKLAIEGKEQEIQRIAAKKPTRAIERPVVKRASRTQSVKPQAVVETKLRRGRPRLNRLPGLQRQEKLVYNIQLRPGYAFEVILPSNTSKDEIERIRNSFNSLQTK